MTKNAQHQSETQEIRLIILAAQMVLENGGETYRVEETAMRMAKGFGMEDVSVIAMPTTLFVDAGGRTHARRITKRGTNSSRLSKVNDVSRRVEHGAMTSGEAERALAAIAAEKGWPPAVMILSYGVAAASFSLLFSGSFGSLLMAFFIGLIIQTMQPLFAHMAMGTLFFNFTGGFLSALLAQSASLVIPYGSVNATIIGGIMPLLTGLLMTTAVRDTIYGDLISGVARAVEALLLAACVAMGVYVGLEAAAMMGGMLL